MMNTRSERPLSPHLQIYRLPFTAVLSITHRLTGVVLSLSLLGLVGILLTIAGNGTTYIVVQSFLKSVMGQGLLLVWLLALFLHFFHGIRHLIWDTAHGFGRTTLTCQSQWELAAAVALTILTWFLF